jgi:hypothetical protein
VNDIPTVEQVVEAIGVPLENWEGNCYGIASLLAESGLVKGRPVYGHFLGKVSEESEMWSARSRHPFVQHGWVELEDGRIVDPTRWSFEAKEPYIWVGEDGQGEYDEGGNELRAAMMGPWPLFDDSQHEQTFHLELLPEIVDELDYLGSKLKDPFDPDQMDRDPLDPEHYQLEVTNEQLFWLANIPVNRLRHRWHARELFTQIEEHGLKGFIPLDNWNMVMKEWRR